MKKTRAIEFTGENRIIDLDEFLMQPNVRYVDLKVSTVTMHGQLIEGVVLVYEEDDGSITGV